MEEVADAVDRGLFDLGDVVSQEGSDFDPERFGVGAEDREHRLRDGSGDSSGRWGFERALGIWRDRGFVPYNRR